MLTAAQLCRRMVTDGLVDTRSSAVLLENILAAVSRATAIIEKTRITHANLLGHDGFCDVAEIIDQSVALGVAEAEKVHAQVSVKHAAAVLRARIDPVHLSQVLANILRNAIQAVANSSIRRIFVTAEPAGDWVRITVTDTGPGISTTMQDKVGSLFFTTRQEGLGMGLAVCREILAKYGGTLDLQNADSGGLRVVLEVPSHGA
jgi:C4-dicarboxylate-specific signal transduction histidine kinase